MKTVAIEAGFTGYPNGKDKRQFVKGETPELANDYAELLVGKGLAHELPAKPKASTPAEKKD